MNRMGEANLASIAGEVCGLTEEYGRRQVRD
jgi:hypothetical protein